MSSRSSADQGQVFSKLSYQEKYALLLLSQGSSDPEIARALFLGEGTVRNYIHSILVKLRLNDRAEATTYAVKHDLRGHMGYRE
jgi:two-component system, NarL family, response regulator DevR